MMHCQNDNSSHSKAYQISNFEISIVIWNLSSIFFNRISSYLSISDLYDSHHRISINNSFRLSHIVNNFNNFNNCNKYCTTTATTSTTAATTRTKITKTTSPSATTATTATTTTKIKITTTPSASATTSTAICRSRLFANQRNLRSVFLSYITFLQVWRNT